MKCHYTIDPKNKKKVFIPMCYGTIHSMEIEDCCCENPLTEHHFEKERFNIILQKKNETIKWMQSEIDHLTKIINKK
jgi:cobalamin biosynthesis Co2+ chelatase CbiK